MIDRTHELFRHFYGQRQFNQCMDRRFGAAVGVLQGVTSRDGGPPQPGAYWQPARSYTELPNAACMGAG
jgi:hypothetical protein